MNKFIDKYKPTLPEERKPTLPEEQKATPLTAPQVKCPYPKCGGEPYKFGVASNGKGWYQCKKCSRKFIA